MVRHGSGGDPAAQPGRWRLVLILSLLLAGAALLNLAVYVRGVLG